MVQQGQTFELTRCGRDGEPLWAYRYRTGGRGSKRVQRGGFASQQDARDALERELERLRRERQISRSLTLAELVETYLAQHDVQPVTIEKLRYLLSKATGVFGDRKIGELTSQGDRRVANEAIPGLPLRGDPGASAGAPPSGGVGNDRRQPGEGRRRQPGAQAQGAASVRVVGGTGGDLAGDRTALRSDDPVRGRDRAAASRMDRTRKTRHRPEGARCLRAALLHPAPAEGPKDGSKHASGTAASASTRRARPDRALQRFAAAVPWRTGRLPRHPPLPPIPLAARPTGGGHQPAPAGLRSPTHVRDLRPPCRHLNLRPLPLHGRQPDHDRPPLRPPRPRRTRARDQPPVADRLDLLLPAPE